MNKNAKQAPGKSTDLLAKEAIDHINSTSLEALDKFVPEEEDRITVLRAWQEKQQEKKREFIDFYLKLRKRIYKNLEGWKKKSKGVINEQIIGALLFLPDLFYLMIKLLFDREVPNPNKGALLAGILYVMLPLDLLPDYLPVLGWVDDLAVTILALNKFLDTRDEFIRVKVEAYWLNDKDFFKTFRQLLDVGDQVVDVLPGKFLNVIKRVLNRGDQSRKD